MKYQVDKVSAPSVTIEAEAVYPDALGNLIFWGTKGSGDASDVVAIVCAGEWLAVSRGKPKETLKMVTSLRTNFGDMLIPDGIFPPLDGTPEFDRWYSVQQARAQIAVGSGEPLPDANTEGL